MSTIEERIEKLENAVFGEDKVKIPYIDFSRFYACYAR